MLLVADITLVKSLNWDRMAEHCATALDPGVLERIRLIVVYKLSVPVVVDVLVHIYDFVHVCLCFKRKMT